MDTANIPIVYQGILCTLLCEKLLAITSQTCIDKKGREEHLAPGSRGSGTTISTKIRSLYLNGDGITSGKFSPNLMQCLKNLVELMCMFVLHIL